MVILSECEGSRKLLLARRAPQIIRVPDVLLWGFLASLGMTSVLTL